MFAGQKVAILTDCPKAQKPLATICRMCLALILGGLGRQGFTGGRSQVPGTYLGRFGSAGLHWTTIASAWHLSWDIWVGWGSPEDNDKPLATGYDGGEGRWFVFLCPAAIVLSAPGGRHRSRFQLEIVQATKGLWLRRKRCPTANAAITLVHARTVAGSGAGTGSIVPAVGE
jgi:hypothetical protein